MASSKMCTHPGRYHLASDGLAILRPHPQAESEMARQQGYIIARIEPAYRELGPEVVTAFNRAAERAARQAEVVKGLMQASLTDAELSKLTDAEIAALVRDHIWAEISMLSPHATLLEAAIDRLEGKGR